MLDFTVLRLRRMVDTEHVAYDLPSTAVGSHRKCVVRP